MAHRMSLAAASVLALAGTAQAQDRASYNRTLTSAHQPIVSRTDYSLDVGVTAGGLAPGEARRLATWFDQLDLGYGDSVTVASAGPPHAAPPEGVGAVLARYGMLVSPDPAPPSVGAPAPGTARVVVSRAVARVEGCPDWSRGNFAEYEGASRSNFGCAAAQNLAAMIANPQDLVEGRHAGAADTGDVTIKAIKSYREAKNTGDGGLPGGVTSVSATKGGN